MHKTRHTVIFSQDDLRSGVLCNSDGMPNVSSSQQAGESPEDAASHALLLPLLWPKYDWPNAHASILSDIGITYSTSRVHFQVVGSRGRVGSRCNPYSARQIWCLCADAASQMLTQWYDNTGKNQMVVRAASHLSSKSNSAQC